MSRSTRPRKTRTEIESPAFWSISTGITSVRSFIVGSPKSTLANACSSFQFIRANWAHPATNTAAMQIEMGDFIQAPPWPQADLRGNLRPDRRFSVKRTLDGAEYSIHRGVITPRPDQDDIDFAAA